MLSYIIFALLVAGTYGQATCRCAAMVTAEAGELILYELPPFDISDCNQDSFCMRTCNDEFAVQTGGGDLNFVNGGTTVGQGFCNVAAGNIIESKFVYSYYNLCNSMWLWAEEMSQQPLCCDHNGLYFECP